VIAELIEQLRARELELTKEAGRLELELERIRAELAELEGYKLYLTTPHPV